MVGPFCYGFFLPRRKPNKKTVSNKIANKIMIVPPVEHQLEQ